MNNSQNPNKRPAVTPQRPNTVPRSNTNISGAAKNPSAQNVQNQRSASQNAGQKNVPPQNLFSKNSLLAICILVLLLALFITVMVCSIKAISDAIDAKNTTESVQTTPSVSTTVTTEVPKQTDPIYTTPVVGAWNEGYTTVPRNNNAVHEGDLVLVNYQYAFGQEQINSLALQDLYNKNLGFGTNYVLHTADLSVSKHIVTSLTKMLADMKEANPSLTSERRLLISSGFRTYDKQQELYNKETVEGLTAMPGHSEHHTGLTIDIRIFEDGKTLYLNTEEQKWIEENCANYGFILRYTDDNKDITGILNEDWHFRYVGVAHAKYMVEHDLCLEEYLAYIRENHCYGKNDPLVYSVGETEYTIYYFPASVENNVTNIYVPSAGYEISGDNINGFIVTVKK